MQITELKQYCTIFCFLLHYIVFPVTLYSVACYTAFCFLLYYILFPVTLYSVSCYTTLLFPVTLDSISCYNILLSVTRYSVSCNTTILFPVTLYSASCLYKALICSLVLHRVQFTEPCYHPSNIYQHLQWCSKRECWLAICSPCLVPLKQNTQFSTSCVTTQNTVHYIMSNYWRHSSLHYG